MPARDGATRAALQQIERDGSDLNKPLQMDFFVAVPDERSGRIVAARAGALGFETKIERDDDTGAWTCYCTKIIIPQHQVVSGIEQQLDELSMDVGGRSDGFGTFGNARDDDN